MARPARGLHGPALLSRPFDVPAAGAGRDHRRHRLQRLSGRRRFRAGHRHHEPRPFLALDDQPRSAHPAPARGLGRRRYAQSPYAGGRRGLCPQRADRHPLLWRHREVRQFDLRLRGGRALHRPSGPSPPRARRAAICRSRPARRGDGRGRWRHHRRSADDDPHPQSAREFRRPADALVGALRARPVPRGRLRRVPRRCAGDSSIELGLRTLPDRPTVVVLQPAFLGDE